MTDEDKFARILENSNCFSFSRYNYLIRHNIIPQTFIEIDNLAWKRNTLFVFEGSRGKFTDKINQLKERFNLFRYNKFSLVQEEGLPTFQNIRVFYYNLKTQRLIEINESGKILCTFSYKDIQELIQILGKL
ncbi:MAG: hypothetical protein KJ767_00805 [Nanoarchaeota archaeon]|nr:hypothetical protein [Nanoarchaeota archaeon]